MTIDQLRERYKFLPGDCENVMRTLPDSSFDVVVTSPPYNLGIAYGAYKDSKGDDEYIDWCSSWAKLIYEKLSDDGSFFLNMAAAPSDPLRPHQIAIQFSKIFNLQNTFHWVKSISIEQTENDFVTVGHFKPINSERYVTDCHEFVFHFTKSGSVGLDKLGVGVPYKHKSNISRWKHTKGKDRRCRGNMWFVPYETINNRSKERPHPATFPVKLAENCIRVHGVDKCQSVLDPFVGIGSAALGALRCGVKSFVGIDIDQDYLRVADDRLIDEAYSSELFVERNPIPHRSEITTPV